MPAEAASSTKWGAPRAPADEPRPGPIVTSPIAATDRATTTMPAAAATDRRFTSLVGRTGVILLGLRPGGLAALGADHPSGEVVHLDVDPAIEARLAGLVRCVKIGGPFKPDVGRGTLLELERTGRDGVTADTTREVLAAGEAGEDLGGRPAEGAVARHVA